MPAELEGGLDAQVIYDPPNLTYPYGAYIAVVDIDPDTAHVTVRRFVAVDDCGVRINPMIVDGQIHGGLRRGHRHRADGGAHLRRGGQLPQLLLHGLPDPDRARVPDFELGETVTPCRDHLLGAKGVGESPNVGSPPAIVNAVIDALHETHGVDHIDMPCTPARACGRRCRGGPSHRSDRGHGRRRRREVAGSCPTSRRSARRLAGHDYLVDEGLATSMFLSSALPQPLLLEGEAGVGKTEAAKCSRTCSRRR